MRQNFTMMFLNVEAAAINQSMGNASMERDHQEIATKWPTEKF
jgi:hypothetical protein